MTLPSPRLLDNRLDGRIYGKQKYTKNIIKIKSKNYRVVFQDEIEGTLQNEVQGEININLLNETFVEVLKKTQRKCVGRQTRKNEKLIEDIKNLLPSRREMKDKHTTKTAEIRISNKNISKAIKKDIRMYNTLQITIIIEQNKTLKVLKRKFYL